VPHPVRDERLADASGAVDARLVPLAAMIWLGALVVPVLPVTQAVVGSVGLVVAGIVLAVRHGHRSSPLPPPRLSRLRQSFPLLPSRLPPTLVFAVVVAVIGGGASSLVTTAHVVASRMGPVPTLAQRTALVSAELRIRTDPVLRPPSRGFGSGYVVLRADIVRITVGESTVQVKTPVLLTGPESWWTVQHGSVVRTVGRLSPTDRGQREVAVLSARAPPTLVEPPGPLSLGAGRLRAGLREAVAGLPEAERGLVPALVVGDVSQLPHTLVADLRTAGLSHLTAVSGTNFTIVLAFVLGVARWTGVRSWGLPVLGVVCTLGFVIVARPEPSVLRAAAMGLVGVVGMAAGTRRHGIPALATAVIALLLFDPWLGRSYGFALSVVATAGIVVLGPRFTAALGSWLPRTVAAALAVPLAAVLPCTPIVAMLSDEVSVVAVVANLVAAPAVVPATVCGFVATLLAPLSVTVAAVPGQLAGLAARWIVEVGTLAARLPGASVSWPATALRVVVLTALCAAAALVAPALLRRWAVVAGLAAVLAIWLVHPVALPGTVARLTGWPPRGWLVVMCDVGQGDALVLRAGPSSALVVDAGPEPSVVDACLDDLGVDRVPYLLLTHFHADHVAGLPGVLSGRSVGEIGVRPHRGEESTERIRGMAAARHVVVSEIGVGERRRAGAVTWSVLWPSGDAVAKAFDSMGADPSGLDAAQRHQGSALNVDSGDLGSVENDASVVILAEVEGLRILLTGDIEPPAQQAILRSGVDLHADVIKVPHHGSRYQDRDFLEATGASIALISVGADNEYGHPGPSTIEMLTALGSTVVRTDLAGPVAIVERSGDLMLVTRKRGGVVQPPML